MKTSQEKSELTIIATKDPKISSLRKLHELKWRVEGCQHFTKHEKSVRCYLWGGHATVIDSLCLGLNSNGETFELNPKRISILQKIGLLAGTDSLQSLVERSRRNRSVQLVVGPNMMMPRGIEHLLTSEAVNRVIVPSAWVRDFVSAGLPEIGAKISIWSAGVDEEFWLNSRLPFQNPSMHHQKKRVLLYIKKYSPIIERVQEFLNRVGIEYVELTYGDYLSNEYKAKLEICTAVIYVGAAESQGLALLQSWSLDVPTFVYHSRASVPIYTRVGTQTMEDGLWSPAPYLTSQCGGFWSDIYELTSLLEGDISSYSPRQWVLKNATAKLAAREYLSLFTS